MSEWKPIATAPKDGSHILVFADGKITSAYFDCWSPIYGTWQLCVPSDGYRDSDEILPILWMTLPNPPETL